MQFNENRCISTKAYTLDDGSIFCQNNKFLIEWVPSLDPKSRNWKIFIWISTNLWQPGRAVFFKSAEVLLWPSQTFKVKRFAAIGNYFGCQILSQSSPFPSTYGWAQNQDGDKNYGSFKGIVFQLFGKKWQLCNCTQAHRNYCQMLWCLSYRASCFLRYLKESTIRPK